MSVDGFTVFPPLARILGAYLRWPEGSVARRGGTRVHVEFKEE